jgi:hypothetical protein
VEQARRGFTKLYEFISSCLADGDRPNDGYYITFLRIILEYPEILAWEYQWHQAKEEIAQLIYGTIKSIKAEAQVGWHVYHRVTWEPIYRAEMDYAAIANYSDWIKPVVYHDIAGVRIRTLHIEKLKRTILREISEQDSLNFHYDILGYEKTIEPNFEEMTPTGLSPDFVYRETKRCVDAVGGRVPVYAGVGFDIPTNGNPVRSTPERVYQAVYKAFEAGASGLIVSREYDEMRIPNLEAVGRAVKDAAKAGL